MAIKDVLSGTGKRIASSPAVLRLLSDDRMMRVFNGVMEGPSRVRAAREKAREAVHVLLNGHELPTVDAALDDSLGETVYLTIDVNGLDPALMPAACAPEPGGLSWYELLAVVRRVIEARRVVGADLVGLAPMHGWRAPNVVAARLLAKVIAYRFGAIGR